MISDVNMAQWTMTGNFCKVKTNVKLFSFTYQLYWWHKICWKRQCVNLHNWSA